MTNTIDKAPSDTPEQLADYFCEWINKAKSKGENECDIFVQWDTSLKDKTAAMNGGAVIACQRTGWTGGPTDSNFFPPHRTYKLTFTNPAQPL